MQTTAVRVALSVCLCVRGLEQQLYKIGRTNRVTVRNVDPLQETVYIRWGVWILRGKASLGIVVYVGVRSLDHKRYS